MSIDSDSRRDELRDKNLYRQFLELNLSKFIRSES